MNSQDSNSNIGAAEWYNQASFVVKKKTVENTYFKRNLFGFMLLGLTNKGLYASLFMTSKLLAKKLKFRSLPCCTKDDHIMSLGIILFAQSLVSLFSKIFLTAMPPFFVSRIVTSLFYATVGGILLTYGSGGAGILLGIICVSYSYGLNEITFVQYSAYFPRNRIKIFTIFSDASAALSTLISFYIINYTTPPYHTTLYTFLATEGLTELIAYIAILKHPVKIEIFQYESKYWKIDKIQKTVKFSEMNEAVESNRQKYWPPLTIKENFQAIKDFYFDLLPSFLVFMIGYVSMQTFFEMIAVPESNEIFTYTCLTTSFINGIFLGRCCPMIYKNFSIKVKICWSYLLVGIQILIFGCICWWCFFYTNSFIFPSKSIYYLAFIQGFCFGFSWNLSQNILRKKIVKKWRKNITSFTLLTELESFAGIVAAICGFVVQRYFFCDNNCNIKRKI